MLAGAELAQGALLIVAVVALPPLPLLLALLIAKATVVAIAEPAANSTVPRLVADDDLIAANAMVGGVRQGGEVLGPLVGGVVVAWAGVRAGVAVDALTFVASVPLLWRIPRLASTEGASTAIGLRGPGSPADALAGLRYTVGHRAEARCCPTNLFRHNQKVPARL